LTPCGRPLATGRESEDFAHDAGLLLVDDEDLLVLGAASLGDLGLVTVGWMRTVPEALAGVLAHRPMNMLSVLTRLMLVKDIQEFTEHLAARVGRHGLRGRDEFHPRLAQLTDIEFGVKRIAAESAQRMDDDESERPVGSGGLIDHLLKDRPIVVERGSSWLAEASTTSHPWRSQ
jgi:hypothetical protein